MANRFKLVFSVMGMLTVCWLYLYGFIRSVPDELRVLLDIRFYSGLYFELFMLGAASAFFGRVSVFSARLMVSMAHALLLDFTPRAGREKKKGARKIRFSLLKLKKWLRSGEWYLVVAMTSCGFLLPLLGLRLAIDFAVSQFFLFVFFFTAACFLFFRRPLFKLEQFRSFSRHRINSALIIVGALFVGQFVLLLGQARFVSKASIHTFITLAGDSSISAAIVAATYDGVLTSRDMTTRRPFGLILVPHVTSAVFEFVPFENVISISARSGPSKEQNVNGAQIFRSD